MERTNSGGFIKAGFLSVAVLTVFLLAFPMESMAWQRHSSRTFSNGRTSTRSITGARTAGGYTRDSTYTGPRGRTSTRNARGQWDSQTRTWNKNVTSTGPNGRSATRNTTATRTDNGYSSSSTVTGPQGNSATRNTQGQWDADTGTWTKTSTTSGTGQ